MADTEQYMDGVGNRNGHASIAELTRRVSQDASDLVRAELDLAKLEIAQRLSKAAAGGGMLTAAAVFLIAGLGTLVATAVLALATAMDAWLAALIVGLVLLAFSALVALLGMRKLRSGAPPVPAETVQRMKEDVQWVKQHATSGER